MTSTGERIKQARLVKGLSQVALAKAAKVSQPTVANWENDSHAPRQAALLKIANILGTSSHWINHGADDEDGRTLTPRHYLNTPIKHIPVIDWPDEEGQQDPLWPIGLVHDYIAISTNAAKPFAVIANDPAMAAEFPIGSIIILDTDVRDITPSQCYLFSLNGKTVLRRWQENPNRLEACPNQSPVKADFVTETPTALARVVMSIKKY
jgi:transcriptional regulator with XRE-family HTH domain